jgi:hypothetical protein
MLYTSWRSNCLKTEQIRKYEDLFENVDFSLTSCASNVKLSNSKLLQLKVEINLIANLFDKSRNQYSCYALYLQKQ